ASSRVTGASGQRRRSSGRSQGSIPPREARVVIEPAYGESLRSRYLSVLALSFQPRESAISWAIWPRGNGESGQNRPPPHPLVIPAAARALMDGSAVVPSSSEK